MKPVFSFSEIRNIEKQIIERENFPSIVLMENAGKNSLDILIDEYPDLENYNIFILTGKGNNAGDGFTLARHLEINKIDFRIVPLEHPSEIKGDALINLESLVTCDIGQEKFIRLEEFIQSINSFQKHTKILLIDALLGTGIAGDIRGKYRDIINYISVLQGRFRNLRTVSLDIPSGLMSGKSSRTLVSADLTISMGTQKEELLFGDGREHSGKVLIAPIGVTDKLFRKYDTSGKDLVELSDVQVLFPRRKKTSHKYSNGKVLVIGGSAGLSGSVIMSALSAIKAGAGAVCAAIPESLSPLIGKKHFEIMKVSLAETSEGSIANSDLNFDLLKKRVNWADTILIGPGISLNEETKQFVKKFIRSCSKKLVIDADALTILAEDLSVLKGKERNIILTPHLGEFSKLANVPSEEILFNRFELLRRFVNEHKVNVSLKSETTVNYSSDGSIYINSTGNEALAEAGSGDVLSGIISAVFSTTGEAVASMICGNYVHGLSADLCSLESGNKQSASPMDIIKLIPDAISIIQNAQVIH